MMTYVFDIPAFRISYPAFADPIQFPDVTLQAYWDAATCYISDVDYGWLSGDCRYNALTLMTAHLAALSVIIASGQIPNIVTGATIDRVTVSLLPPPVKDQWSWWLCITPYGQSLLALLQVNSVGGFFVGGSLTRDSFRLITPFLP